MKLINNATKIILASIFIFLIAQSCERTQFNANPECAISSLEDGKVYLPGEEILISVAASDNEGELDEVQLFINENLIQTFTGAPYNMVWKTWGSNPGDYSIKALARDKSGKKKDNTVKIKLAKGIIYNNNLYNMDLGYLSYYGKVGATYSQHVTLYSNSVISQNYGHKIYIELFSSSPTELDLDSYYYDPLSTKASNTFNYSDFFINYNINTNIGTTGEIVEGVVRVDKTGNNYKIFVNGKNTFNQPIKLYYTGTLSYEDKTK